MLKDFQFSMTTRLHFGPGKINTIGNISKKYGKKAIIVTGKGSSKKIGALDKVTHSLKANNIDYVIYDKIEPNPRTTTIDEGGALAQKENCDFVIGLGGGSPMDASKVVALIAKNGGKTWEYVTSKNPPPEKALPIICITTTSGTGSEANCYSVVTNPETNEKPGFGFECMMPAESIIDPGLCVHMPPKVTSSVGIDVFFHAIEAYTSTISSPMSDMYAEKAIELVSQNLHQAYKNGNDLNARYNMAIANTLAGIAIQHAGVTLIHYMAHPISGHYDCPHGEALASVSIAVIKYNLPAEKEKFIKIANLMGANIAKDDPKYEEKIIKTLRDFYEPLKLNIDLMDLGTQKENLHTLSQDAFNINQAFNINPVTIDKDGIYKLYMESIKTTVK